MIENKYYIYGALFALLAAFCNSTIGILTIYSNGLSLTPLEIAFYRCFFSLTICLILFKLSLRTFDLSNYKKIAICSFFGVFLLYFFESTSYSFTSVSNTTFILMGSSFLLSSLFSFLFIDVEKSIIVKVITILFVLIGILFLFTYGSYQNIQFRNNSFAIIAGIGYSIFLFATRYFNIKPSFNNLCLFLLFGSIYLFIPYVFTIHHQISKNSFIYLMSLGLVPTLFGFYFTMKSISLIDAFKVQMYEILEPVFASVLSILFLKQSISLPQCLGGMLILVGIYFHEKNSSKKY